MKNAYLFSEFQNCMSRNWWNTWLMNEKFVITNVVNFPCQRIMEHNLSTKWGDIIWQGFLLVVKVKPFTPISNPSWHDMPVMCPFFASQERPLCALYPQAAAFVCQFVRFVWEGCLWSLCFREATNGCQLCILPLAMEFHFICFKKIINKSEAPTSLAC